jgi:tRNA-dihydrouridine synthase
MNLMQLNRKITLNDGICIPPVLPGPMEGIMHPLFCRAVSELRLLPCWITPFLRISTAVPRKSKIQSFLSPFTETGIPVIIQLMGVSPELLAETAARAIKLGVSGVNLNFACPSRQVLSSGAGGALLALPEQMNAIVCAVAKECRNHSFSIKIRTGRDNYNELLDIIPAIIDCYPRPDFIAVHFRTVSEMYAKVVDPYDRIISAVKLAGKVPVIANGDILSVGDAMEMFKLTKCDGVMIARGLLKDPFLIKRLTFASDDELLPDVASGRNIFFNKVMELVRCYPDEYWRRSWLIELANYMWGGGSSEFTNLLQLSDDELFDLQLAR